MLAGGRSCCSFRLVQPPPANSPTARETLCRRFLCTPRRTLPACSRAMSSARIAPMESNSSSSSRGDSADQPLGSFGFLTKKVYVPPPWASHLRPLPTHVCSLGHVSFSVYRRLFASCYSGTRKQRVSCIST